MWQWMWIWWLPPRSLCIDSWEDLLALVESHWGLDQSAVHKTMTAHFHLMSCLQSVIICLKNQYTQLLHCKSSISCISCTKASIEYHHRYQATQHTRSRPQAYQRFGSERSTNHTWHDVYVVQCMARRDCHPWLWLYSADGRFFQNSCAWCWIWAIWLDTFQVSMDCRVQLSLCNFCLTTHWVYAPRFYNCIKVESMSMKDQWYEAHEKVMPYRSSIFTHEQPYNGLLRDRNLQLLYNEHCCHKQGILTLLSPFWLCRWTLSSLAEAWNTFKAWRCHTRSEGFLGHGSLGFIVITMTCSSLQPGRYSPIQAKDVDLLPLPLH